MFSRWCIFLLSQCAGWTGATSAKLISVTSTHASSTCPSRTANYLTHNLPQQCLASSRAVVTVQAPNSSLATDATTTSLATTVSSPLLNSADIPITETQNESVTPRASASTTTTTSSLADTHKAVITVTASAVSNQDLIPALPEIIEEDSSLEGSSFLSFEEWKKRNLQKAGQSEHVGRDANAAPREGRSQQSSMQNSLDSFGDEVEIDLDFSGFVPGGSENPHIRSAAGSAVDSDSESKSKTVSSRNKDAGTTCKERFNYASFDCAASLLKTNPQAKSPGSVLNENKDAYMLNECSAENKFIILELCNDILVDTVVLANFEFFSSIFRTFRVSVSDRYPVKLDKWKTLGIFEARNTREVQAFLVENPVIWARYLRIEFLTHYGTEYYCPVSLVRVHGTTMLEEYKHDMAAGVADEEDSEVEESVISVEESLIPEAVDQGLWDRKDSKTVQTVSSSDPPVPSHGQATDDNLLKTDSDDSCSVVDVPANMTMGFEHFPFPAAEEETCSESENPTISPTISSTPLPTQTSSHVAAKTATSYTETSLTTAASKPSDSATANPPSSQSSKVTTKSSQNAAAASIGVSPQSENSTDSASGGAQSSSATPQSKQSSVSTEKTKQTGSATQPIPASPTMQESFFKSVQKRLQMLESNSSLSLQYIEEQSQALRDAFRRVEQRQLSKTTIFLDHLNATVQKELREFRQQYDQLWQSTVIELTMQREQYQRENQAMHARLGVLADELIFQKRMSILQMTLILICLGLVLFSRGAINNYLELPLVQSVLSRSPSTRWMNLSGDSPSNPRKLTRARSAHQIGLKPNGILKGHRRLQSDDSNLTDTLSQSEIYSPPTPVSFDGYSDASQPFRDDAKLTNDLEFDPEMIERPSTSPPVLPSSTATTPRLNGQADFASIRSRMLTPGSSEEILAPTEEGVRQRTNTPPLKHLKWDLPELQNR